MLLTRTCKCKTCIGHTYSCLTCINFDRTVKLHVLLIHTYKCKTCNIKIMHGVDVSEHYIFIINFKFLARCITKRKK